MRKANQHTKPQLRDTAGPQYYAHLYDHMPTIAAICVLVLLSLGLRLYSGDKQTPTLSAVTTAGRHAVLTIENHHPVDIGQFADTSAAFIRLNMDSIIQQHITKQEIRCKTLTQLTVPPGSPPTQFRLPDSTLVYLNADSRIRYPVCFATDKREIVLQGEAYFEVAQDTRRAFEVKSGDMLIKVLGTAFNVSCYADRTTAHVALVQGKVRVSSGNNVKQLVPGQRAILNRRKNGLETDSFDQKKVLAWRDGKYIFSKESLVEICNVVSRMRGVRIIIDKTSLNHRSFSGAFERQKLQPLLDFLRATGGINHYYDTKGQLHLY